MYILLLIWLGIDVVLLALIPSREQIAKYPDKMWKRSIERVKKTNERAMDVLTEFGLLIFLCCFIYIIIRCIPNIGIQIFLEWYKGIFIVALFPMLFSWFKGNNFSAKSKETGSFLILAIFISMVGTLIDTESVESIVQNRGVLNVLITMFVVIFLVVLYRMRMGSEHYYSKRLPKKGIRKDLHYRTPRLIVNVSNVDLIRHCERYFDEYISRYRRMKELHTIEYVNLAGIYRKLWYEKSAYFMKTFVLVTIFIVIISMKFDIS